jgi:hypothetical protein
MNLQLEKCREHKKVEKGDIIVCDTRMGEGGKLYYLVIEDRISNKYTLLNMRSNHLMSRIAVRKKSDLIDEIERRMSQISVVDIISLEEYEVKLKSLIKE